MELALANFGSPFSAISPYREMGAYEALWCQGKKSFKYFADLFRANPSANLSSCVEDAVITKFADEVTQRLDQQGIDRFGIRVRGTFDYPPWLLDAKHPTPLLYFQGLWDLAYAPKLISVVGTRHPTLDSVKRTRKLVRLLVEDGFTIVSGLAEGIDTVALETAIELGSKVIAVIGTPITQAYPESNKNLQQEIAKNHLLVSQVPIKYATERNNPVNNRVFFPERNITMSALSRATVIIEAGETSGTLIQACAALHQKRKLFILNSCFENKSITWPAKYAAKGATRVTNDDDIQRQFAAD